MSLFLYFTAFSNIFLGIVTFYNNPRSRKNIFLLLSTIAIAAWAISNAQFINASDQDTMYFWAIAAYIIATLLLISVNILVHSFGNSRKISTLIIIITLYGIVSPFIKDYIATGVNFSEKTITPGIAYITILFVYLAIAYDIIRSLIYNYKIAAGIDKQVQKIIFIGIVGSLVSGLTTNLIFPAIGIYGAVTLGPAFSFFFIFFISYAIIKYKTFDTRILLGRVIYYLILSSLPYIGFYIFGYIYIYLFGSIFQPVTYLLGIFISLIFTLFFSEFNKFIKEQINTRFVNPGYDPYKVVDELSKNLAITLKLEEVSNTILNAINKTLRPSFSLIFIIDKSEDDKYIYHKYGKDLMNSNIQPDKYENCMFIWEKIDPIIIIYDEFDKEASDLKDVRNWMEPIKSLMLSDKIKVITPLGVKEKIVGMLLLGEKESGDIYTSQDIDLLNSIANTAGLATARSLFYEEVNNLNSSLKQKIETATNKLTTQNTNLEIAISRIQKLRQREQDMLDILGHELRTPITIVRNALAFLKSDFATDKYIDPERLGSYIDKALEASKRELIIIETLLSATKIDANRVQISLDKINIIDVIRLSIEAQANFAKEKNIEIKFTPPTDGEWYIYADNTRTQEIQDNFVSNAVKYTLKGYVYISIRKIIDSVTNKKFIEVRVEDSGIGIPKDDIKKLGGKFFRARQYIKEGDHDAVVVRSGGTGLGLYVSFELVRIMGGNIDITSEIGRGSAFIYTLPEYIGQPKKFIDQTFDGDEKLSDNQIINTTDIINRSKSIADLDDDDDQADITSAKAAGFYKLTTANDVIKKINEGKKYLEDGDRNHSDSEI